MERIYIRVLRIFLLVISFLCAFTAGFFLFTVSCLAQLRTQMVFDRYEEEDGIIYAGGSKPVFTIYASEDEETYLEVCREEKSRQYETIKVEEKLVMSFEEGRYRLLPFVLSPEGEKIFARNFPLSFVYDNTAPEDIRFEVTAPGSDPGEYQRGDYDIFSSQKVTVKVRCSDKLSGLSQVFMEMDGKTQEGDTVVIESGKSGKILAWCVDRCKNESPAVELSTRIFVDRQPPEGRVERREDDGGVIWELDFTDRESGIRDVVVYWNDKVIKKADLSSQREGVYKKSLKIRIDPRDMELGENTMKARCRDLAGNSCELEGRVTREDRVFPRITIGGIKQGEICTGSVSPVIEISDENLDKESINIRVKRRSLLSGDADYNLRAGEEAEFEEDGSYEISVRACDMAGNESVVKREFTIDNTPPAIEGLERLQGKKLESFELKGALGSMFRDESFVDYRLYLNGRDFSEYERISRPGKYVLKVVAQDQAGNMNSRTASFEIVEGKEPVEVNNRNENMIRRMTVSGGVATALSGRSQGQVTALDMSRGTGADWGPKLSEDTGQMPGEESGMSSGWSEKARWAGVIVIAIIALLCLIFFTVRAATSGRSDSVGRSEGP